MNGAEKFGRERYANLTYSLGECLAISGTDSKGTIRKSVDTDELSVLSVLTFPCVDLAGDYVNPQGLRFHEHIANPVVDVEHSRHPDFGNLTIAKCQHPDGRYAVEYRTLTLDDGAAHSLPVAKSYFDRDSKPSMQVFAMVERDILPGVSLEFKALSGRPLGRSPLENRPAYDFDRVSVVKYTHCAVPVCPGAMTVTKSLDALLPVVQSGRIGSEPLDPTLLGVLRKSVATYTPRRVLVAGGFTAEKAMPHETDPNASPDTVYSDVPVDDGSGDPAMGGDDAPAMGGIAAMYAKVQALLDCCEQNEQDMQTSDSPELRKFMDKMRTKISAIAEEIKGMADKHDAKLNGGSAPDSEGDDSEGGEESDEPEEVDTDRDEEGVLKAVRPVYKSILAARARRFTKAEIDAAPVQADDAHADETIEQAIARIERDDPDGYRRIVAATREHKRVSAWAD
jgi:hypothetical protein